MDRILFAYVNSTRFDRTEHYLQCEWAAVYASLKDELRSLQLDALEYGLLGGPERALVRALEPQPSAVVLWTSVHEAPATLRAARMIHEVVPACRIVVWGDGPLWMPSYFAREPFDVWVTSGDPERVLADTLLALSRSEAPTHGVGHRIAGKVSETSQGLWQPPDSWGLPSTDLLSPEAYDAARDHRGKPGRDLSITVARGCGLRCGGCVDPIKSGARDRRLPIPRLVDFLSAHAADGVTFQLHGPTFGADSTWCTAFATALAAQGMRVPFKFVTLLAHAATPGFLAPLAQVGAVGCGVGLETLAADGRRLERKIRERDVEHAATLAQAAGVKLTAYVQVGLPGQKRADIIYTLERLTALGYRLRPTGHTPFQRLRQYGLRELESLDLYHWDRKSFWEEGCGLSRGEMLMLVAAPEVAVPRLLREAV